MATPTRKHMTWHAGSADLVQQANKKVASSIVLVAAFFSLCILFSFAKNHHSSINRLSSLWHPVRPPVLSNPFGLVLRQVALAVES